MTFRDLKRPYFKPVLVSLVLWSCLSPGAPAIPAAGGKPSVYVDADQYVSHADQSADLSGHVKIIRGTEQLTCDKAHVNLGTSDVLAEGSVTLVSPTDFIKADRMQYNFSTHKGVVTNGFIQMGQETIEGREIYKLSETQYVANDATYTSCTNCPPAWKIAGSKIDATVGEYAYITTPMVRLYGVPVFWFPYAILPIKTERQSGLLAPSFAFNSTDGSTFSESYFWAIDKSQDATVGETYYQNRGLKHSAEYRFVNDKNSKGLFQSNFINDFGFGEDPYTAPDPRYAAPRQNPHDIVSRFGLHYEHHLELQENYVTNANINLVRDTRYLIDFPHDMNGAGDAALENRVSLAKNTENTGASIDADIYENMLRGDPTGQNNDAVHRLPEIKYSIMPTHLFNSNLEANLDVNYVNFTRPDIAYDEVNGIPGFQVDPNPAYPLSVYAGDRYRTGQRLSVHPNLTLPINVNDMFDLVPEVAYEETYYNFGYSTKPATSRRYVRATLDARTRLSSVFGEESKDPKARRYKHEMIPEINYTNIPWLYQETHPFFLGNLVRSNTFSGNYIPHYSSTQPVTESDNIQFDYRDRLADLNLVTFGLTNFLIQKKYDGATASYRQLIRHSLTQSYDFYTLYGPQSVSNGGPTPVAVIVRPWGYIHSLLEAHLDYFDIYNDVTYYTYDSAANNSTTLAIHDTKGNSLGLGYGQSFGPLIDPATTLPTNGVNLASFSETGTVKAAFTTKYLDVAGILDYDLIANTAKDYIFYNILKPPGKCWGIGFTYQYVIGAKAATFTMNLPINFGNGSNLNSTRPPGI